MKTIEQLRMEIDLEMIVYCSLHTDMCVHIGMREIDDTPWYNYLFSYNMSTTSDVKSVSGIEHKLASSPPGLIEIGYEKLDDLIADWPVASQSVWGLLQSRKIKNK